MKKNPIQTRLRIENPKSSFEVKKMILKSSAKSVITVMTVIKIE
jgi:hypothetical protein